MTLISNKNEGQNEQLTSLLIAALFLFNGFNTFPYLSRAILVIPFLSFIFASGSQVHSSCFLLFLLWSLSETFLRCLATLKCLLMIESEGLESSQSWRVDCGLGASPDQSGPVLGNPLSVPCMHAVLSMCWQGPDVLTYVPSLEILLFTFLEISLQPWREQSPTGN